MKLAIILLCAMCLTCASPPPLNAPDWTAMPPGIAEAFCQQLLAEGVAVGGPVAIVNTTQPIATLPNLGLLAGPDPNRVTTSRAMEALSFAQKTIPITLGEGSCKWTAIDAANANRHHDQLIVEMSSPLADPFHPGRAGIFVRVSLAGEHGSLYWMPLVSKNGNWAATRVQVLSN